MSSVVFREASEGDYQAIASLVKNWEELFRVYPRGSYPLTPEQLRALALVRSDLTVAVHDGDVAGFANLYDLIADKQAFIGNVIVERARRGKGIGRALINHMINLAFNKHHVQKVRISVFSDNTPALLLYSSLGFSPYSIEERRDPQGVRVALIHMTMDREDQRR